MYRFYYDAEKAIESILYVAPRISEMHAILNAFYLADKEHLSRYGRFIFGEWYFAHIYGAMGDSVYQIMQHIRWGSAPNPYPLKMAGNIVIPLRSFNPDVLSESDIECLDSAIQKYEGLSFTEFRDLTYDDAYKATRLNDHISLDAIVRTLPDSELILEHLAG